MGLNGRLSLLANFSETEEEESDGKGEDGKKYKIAFSFKILLTS